MSVHFEVRQTDAKGREFVLVEGISPSTWVSVNTPTFRTMLFDTRGGARNYLHKHQIKGARIVRVSSNEGAPK